MQHTSAVKEQSEMPDAPPGHFVRHCFWKYPLIAGGLAILLIGIALVMGSPNSARDTIAGVSQSDPGGAILAFTQELDGTAASWENAESRGMGEPSQVFVLEPVSDYATLLGEGVEKAVNEYREADVAQRQAWAGAYEQALETITPQPTGGVDASGTTPSPDHTRVESLQGEFGPVPALVQADLVLAQRGYLEQYLVGRDPGHSLQLGTIWLYDHPAMLNTAIDNGLTDDQWGMVKERGFPVGPWYLIIPAIFHVKFPGGSVGTGFVLWNLFAALIFLFVVPLV
ncbi:hypothetical protein MNBD_ACTINO01-1343, partial [hydrothermal vent metagenome]